MMAHCFDLTSCGSLSLEKVYSFRGRMLEESYAFQQFSANVDEEEAWIAEKQRLLVGGDLGDTMAAVQVIS